MTAERDRDAMKSGSLQRTPVKSSPHVARSFSDLQPRRDGFRVPASPAQQEVNTFFSF